MKNRIAAAVLSAMCLAGIGGCAAEVATPGVQVDAVVAPFVWVGPGYYGGVYYREYPGPGRHFRGGHRHDWR